MEKVYCGECKYYKDSVIVEYCESPRNIVDNYKNKSARYYEQPEIINHNNHCTYFKKKERSDFNLLSKFKKFVNDL